MDHGRSFEYRNLRSANEFSMRSLKIPWWVITLTSSSRKCVDAPIFLSSNKSRWVILENASLEKKYSKTLREKIKTKVLRFIAENFRSKIHAKILPSFCLLVYSSRLCPDFYKKIYESFLNLKSFSMSHFPEGLVTILIMVSKVYRTH